MLGCIVLLSLFYGLVIQNGDQYMFVDYEDVIDEDFDFNDEGYYAPPNVLDENSSDAKLAEVEEVTVTLDDQGTTVLVAEGGKPGLGSKALSAAAKKGKYRSQVRC